MSAIPGRGASLRQSVPLRDTFKRRAEAAWHNVRRPIARAVGRKSKEIRCRPRSGCSYTRCEEHGDTGSGGDAGAPWDDGFVAVESVGLFGRRPEAVAAMLADSGLRLCSANVGFTDNDTVRSRSRGPSKGGCYHLHNPGAAPEGFVDTTRSGAQPRRSTRRTSGSGQWEESSATTTITGSWRR